MYLIIHTKKDLFEFNIFKKIEKTDFDRVFEELKMVFGLIDVLKLNQKLGL